MSPEELRNTLLGAGVDCRVHHEEVLIRVCVFCGNDRENLELSAPKGVYHCWACRHGGRLDGLLQQITGGEFHIAVRHEPKGGQQGPRAAEEFTVQPLTMMATRWLGRRNIPLHVARQYGIVICIQEDHLLTGRLVIPALDYWTGEHVGWWGRTYTGKRPKYLTTLDHRVCGWRRIGEERTVVVVEGAFDGIAAHRAGYSAAVLSGIETAGEGWDAFVARVPRDHTLVIMLDPEASDRARSLYWRAVAMRGDVVNVTLQPGEDPASVGPSGVRSAIAAAG